MKQLLLSTLLSLFAVAAFAQKGSVTATIVDAETGNSVVGAVLTVAPTSAPENKQGFASGYKGAASISSLAYGEYALTVSFIGYNNLDTTFRLSTPRLNLGTLKLKPGVQIETVVKEVKAMRTSQKGDTVSYNAGAFKVTNDADVEGLLKKMPGITVTDGVVETQGEEIKKVFVDGKEFFGEDVTTAIKSLPAEAVDRVEVYNKLSDAAEFSGMDDGEGYKALNIVTKPGMRQGQFGKFYAGFGYDAETATEDKFKYLAGGNANIFSGDSRVSFIGLFNNVNQQNFSFEDILGVSGGGGGRRGGVGQYMMRPQSGVATVNALGVNYSDTWGKRDQVSVQGSYFFNNTDTRNLSTVDKWYEAPMALDTLMTRGNSDTKGYNHRFNARLEWKISENQNLMIRPRFSYQSNDRVSTTYGWQFGAPEAGGSGYSNTYNYSNGLQHGYNIGTSAVYRAKLGKAGRTITVDGSFSYQDNKNNSRSWSNELGSQTDRPETIAGFEDEIPFVWDPSAYLSLRYLRNMAPSSSTRVRGNFTYTEPVAKYAQVSLQYRMSYNTQERDTRTYVTGSDFSIEGLLPDLSLSNSYRSGYLTQSVGPGFRYAKDRSRFIANVYYQRSTLDGEVVRGEAVEISHSYNNVTYFMMGELNINRENTLRLFVSSYTDSPTVTDLQSVYDVSDAQNISHGNKYLRPSYAHRVNFHYVLLEAAYAFELRTSGRVPEIEFQHHGGCHLHQDAEHAGRYGGPDDGIDFGRRAERCGESGLRLPGRAGKQHFGERRLHALVERNLQRGDQLDGYVEGEEPLFQPHGAGQPETGLPAGLHADGKRRLHAVPRLHERLRGELPAVQRLAGQEDLPQPAGRDHDRRERPAEPEQGLRPHDGLGLDAECHEQRHRTLLHGAVYLQPAAFRQEGLAEYPGLRGHGPSRPASGSGCASPADALPLMRGRRIDRYETAGSKTRLFFMSCCLLPEGMASAQKDFTLFGGVFRHRGVPAG